MCFHSLVYVTVCYIVYLPCVHINCHVVSPLNFYLGTYYKVLQKPNNISWRLYQVNSHVTFMWLVYSFNTNLKVHHKVDMPNKGRMKSSTNNLLKHLKIYIYRYGGSGRRSTIPHHLRKAGETTKDHIKVM